MSEDWKVQVSIKSGSDLLNVRGQNAQEVDAEIDEARQKDHLKRFFEKGHTFVGSTVTTTPVPSAVTVEQAQEAVTQHLGPEQELASAAQIAVAAKKSGKSVEELQGISKAEVKKLIAGEDK